MKIADFGLSALVQVGEDGYHESQSSRRKVYFGLHEVSDLSLTFFLIPLTVTQPWGTVDYEAPEVLNHAYGPQVDAWAAGCLLFEMLGAQKAFFRREGEPNRAKLQQRIRDGEFDFRRYSPLSPLLFSPSHSAPQAGVVEGVGQCEGADRVADQD